MMRLRLMMAALLLGLAGSAHAVNSRAGTTGAQFLKIGAGARAGGMADAFMAIADDASAAYYNPAGMTQLKATQISGAHTSYFQGMNYEVLDLVYPFGRGEKFSRHAIGFGVYYLSIGDIERRSEDSTDPTGKFTAADGAYALSYAYAYDRRLSLGGTGKYIVQNIDSYNARSFAMDLGAHYQLNPDAVRPVKVAATIRNIGDSANAYTANTGDPLPLAVTFGAACQAVPKRLNLELDISKYRDTDPFVALGSEYLHPVSEGVAGALRFGYSSQRNENEGLNGISMGAGITYYKASIDFAWIPFGTLGDTFRFGLGVKF